MSDETKSIIFCYLTLFISVIIPIDIDGCFRTIKIIQDNIRPFVVVFITLSATIYLKIYNDVEKRHNDDVEKFKEDFHNAYEKLQKDIKIYQDCNLDQDSAEKQGVEFERQKIKTNLRYLMRYKIIHKKENFLAIYENYLLWKKPEQMYACDVLLPENINLLQFCINEVFDIDANRDSANLNFCFVDLSDIQFRNINIVDKHCLNVKEVDLGSSNFSKSNIHFISRFTDISIIRRGNFGYQGELYKYGNFGYCIFSQSKITFYDSSIDGYGWDDYKFPRTYAICASNNSKFSFKIHFGKITIKNDEDIESVTQMVDYVIGRLLDANRIDNAIFEFNFPFPKSYSINDKNLYDILTKEVEKYNDKNKKIVILFY